MQELELHQCIWTDLPGSNHGARILVIEGTVEYRSVISSQPKDIPNGPAIEIHEGPLEVHSKADRSVIHYKTFD